MTDEQSCYTPAALLTRIVALEKHVDRVERDLAEATILAQREADRVLDVAIRDKAQQNEWRGTVNDIMSQMLTRNEYNQAHGALTDKLEVVDKSFRAQEGAMMGATRSSQQIYTQRNQNVIWVLLGIASFIAVLGIILDLTIAH